jgi:hypothetical protein
MNPLIVQKLSSYPPHLWIKQNKKLLYEMIQKDFNVNIDNDINPFSAHRSIITVAEHIDWLILDNYFSSVWKPWVPGVNPSIINKINERASEAYTNRGYPWHILDVGCGDNVYNDYYRHDKDIIVTGLDPYNKNADHISTISSFYTHEFPERTPSQFDEVLCLGSINFGSADVITKQLEQLFKMLKPGGIATFRVNPGQNHPSPDARWIQFFPWDETFIFELASAWKLKWNGEKTIELGINNKPRWLFEIEKPQ